MLALTSRRGAGIVMTVPPSTAETVLTIHVDGTVKVAIDAPPQVLVHRQPQTLPSSSESQGR